MPTLLAAEDTLWDLISKTLSESGGVEKTVFYLLIAFSLASWSIIFWKLFSFFEASRNSKKFLAIFDGADSFGEAMAHGSSTGQSPAMSVFKAAMQTLEHPNAAAHVAADARSIKVNPGKTRDELVEMVMQHTAREYFMKLQYGLGFLATAGSATPFIGLFGTVWGILTTFRHIGLSDKNNLASVGSGIASALIATAAGLAVAIPAVIAYNAFLANIDALQDRTDRFIERVMMLVRSSGCFGAAAPTHAPVVHAAVVHAAPAPTAPVAVQVKPHVPAPAPVAAPVPNAG